MPKVYGLKTYTKTTNEKTNGRYIPKMLGVIEGPVNKMFEKLKQEVSITMDKMPDLSGPDTPLDQLEKSFAGGQTF